MSALTIDDAKAHLNITGSSTDVELQAMIDAAEAAIVKRVGPLVSTTVTARVYSNGYGALMLPTLPVLSLTSVTPVNGTALSLSDLYLDTTNGLVTDANGCSLLRGWYTVVYAAGRSSVPADLLLAVKELVRHLWTSQRGSGAARPGAATMPDGASYSLPNRVLELLAPHTSLGIG